MTDVPLLPAKPAPTNASVTAIDYLLALRSASDQRAAPEFLARPDTAPESLKGLLHAAVDSLARTVENTELGRSVSTQLGAMRLDEFLVTRCVEGVVHGLDLAACVPDVGLIPDPAAVKLVAKTLLFALSAKSPGKAVEVRVPPVAAVQCVEGPRHTRGTPPNVVETDPLSWIELATGRLPWQDLADDGRLRASGERSDLRWLLPLT